MHLGDSIFIFILALVLFGPKKLPEMAKQIGKLMAEFRRASNDFRMQIDEELRAMERQEQQKKQEAARLAASQTPSVLPPVQHGELTAGNSLPPESGDNLQILPPSLGEQVSAGTPYAISAPADPVSAPISSSSPEDTPIEDHPLLRVDSIPVDPEASPSQPTGLAAAEANAARLTEPGSVHEHEPEQASLHNG
jgi:sec-independent protein translocase protein TatB